MKKYHMQKSEREINAPDILLKVLLNGKYTSVALADNNEPYIITLSYGYDKVKNCLYFHTAKKGLKMEILKKNPLVCGTIIEDLGYKYNECSHAYRSVVFGGKITIIKDLEEMKYAFNVLLSHLEENVISLRNRLLPNDQIYSDVCLLRLDIQWITGKGSN